jgi:Protein of unknown function (DUF1488)
LQPSRFGRTKHELSGLRRTRPQCFFVFPEDARWNDSLNAVEFGVEIGEYAGAVRVSRRVFQGLLTDAPTSEKCVEGYYLHRTRLERIAERKLRHRVAGQDRLAVRLCGPPTNWDTA